jgi:outer membrane protein insertion porin family
MNKYNYFWLLALTITIVSCSGLNVVPEGDLLYTGTKVKIEDKEVSKKEKKAIISEAEELVVPKPNKSILGMRPSLFFYNLAGDVKKDKGFKHWLKYKIGKEPVLFSKVDLDYNIDLIQNFAENNGYFKAKTVADSSRNGKKASVEYHITLGNQYVIGSITLPTDTTILTQEIKKSMDKTLLEVGKPYRLENIKLERLRIDQRLKENGFFFFNENFILFQLDSTVTKKEVALILKVKNETPENARKQFRINEINVYPNFKINDTLKSNQEGLIYKDFNIYDSENLFKPSIYDHTLYFKKGDLYNRTNHNLSLNRLITLGTFKFVKNQFTPVEGMDGFLDANYYLTPLTKKSIQTEALVKTNSANFYGSELKVNWSNRNTFRAAELLTISAFGGIEAQYSGQNNGFNVYLYGAETSLIWPRFISPFKMHSPSGFVPRTKVNISYENQIRKQLYTLYTYKSSFGYLWKENERKEHELKVTEVTYANSTKVSDLYLEQIQENPSLANVIEKQLIFGPTYSYTYTNTMIKEKKHTIYFKGGVDFSANLTGLLMGTSSSEEPKTILNVPFSEFVKAETEFRYYINLGGELKLATRAILGYGYAYGNSTELPYIKQFFIGGTNSIRAFRARSIGPGSFDGNTSTDGFLPDQSGDLKMEFNTELRGKLYKFIKGAVFVDAGNIWLLNEDPLKPGSAFSSNFIKEMAVGTGLGLRFDFSFLILRTDFAFPLKYNTGRFLEGVDVFNSSWLNDNYVFNLAFGYPF